LASLATQGVCAGAQPNAYTGNGIYPAWQKHLPIQDTPPPRVDRIGIIGFDMGVISIFTFRFMMFSLSSSLFLDDDMDEVDADDFDIDFDEDYELLSDEEFEVFIDYDEYDSEELDVPGNGFCLDDFDDFDPEEPLSEDDIAEE